jgi:hypothetical protein
MVFSLIQKIFPRGCLKKKINKTLRVITDFESKSKVTLLEMQQLMGNLNHVGQMCPFFLNLTFALT